VAYSDGEDAGEADLGEMAAEVEIAPGFSFAVDGRVDPFLHVAGAAGERLGDFFGGLVIGDAAEFFVVVEFDAGIRVPGAAPDDSLLADDEAAVLELGKGGQNVFELFVAGAEAAVVPVDDDGIEHAIGIGLLAGGEVHFQVRVFGEAFLGEAFALDFDLGRIGEVEGAQRGVVDMAGEIGEGAAAEIKPDAPRAGVVEAGLVGAIG
jgi:hypothetical protein